MVVGFPQRERSKVEVAVSFVTCFGSCTMSFLLSSVGQKDHLRYSVGGDYTKKQIPEDEDHWRPSWSLVTTPVYSESQKSLSVNIC